MPETVTTTSPGTRVIEETDEQLEPLYHLILLDDDSHTYQYVVRMMTDLFGYSPEKGYAIACVVDSQGQAIVMTDCKSKAEQKQNQIHSYGADPLMEISLGSMSAILEPVE
jgi:ATP-dependent Clp protease adaptor protein ClpS